MNRNSYIFIEENPFDNALWKMAPILSRPIYNTEFSKMYYVVSIKM